MIHRLSHTAYSASRHWSAWLLLYLTLALAAQALVNPQHGFYLLLPQGGILLAALLVMPSHRAQRLGFLTAAGLIDFGIHTVLADAPPLAAAWISISLLLQACLGAYLLQLQPPWARHPNTQRGILLFLLWGCLVPVTFSSLIAALAHVGAHNSLLAEWLWWFMQRLSALLLLAPLLVLLFHRLPDAERLPPTRPPAWEFVALWILTCGAAAVAFSISNPAGRALATYSFLLTPLLVIVAIRLPLTASLFVVLSATIVAGAADALGAGDTQDSAQRSLIALFAFQLINLVIVWLLGTLIDERRRALWRAQKMRDMYEMLSNANQALINLKLTPAQHYERMCKIITSESDFSKACITTLRTDPIDTTAVPSPPSNICVHKDKERQLADPCEPVCPVVQQVLDSNDSSVTQHAQGSVAAFPIRPDGKTIHAVLTVFSGQSQAFDADMVRLFDELAGDIAFALNMMADRHRLKLTSEVFEHSHESIIIADAEGRILDVNPSFTRITGHTREEAIGRNPRMLQSGRQDKAFYQALWHSLLTEGNWTGEFWNARKNGEFYPQRGTITAVRDDQGNIEHFISVMEDVTAQVQAEERIMSLANFDALTGLPNRLLLESRFRQAPLRTREVEPELAVLFIDLDEFKHVNDALGHQQGDKLLRLVAERLQGELRDSDTLARFGGDEFVVLVVGKHQELDSLAKRLIRQIRQPYQLNNQSVHIGCSIGIALAPQDGSSLNELIQAADTAMYQAKSRGRGVFAFYSSEMQDQAQSHLRLRGELDKALQRNELRVHYQPKVHIAKGTLVGFEALVRWQHPERGLVTPGQFIPAAEMSGQITAIDRWMLGSVIDQLSRWRQAGYQEFPVAVNVSASLFSRTEFVDELAQWLKAGGVPARLLELEITEHVAMLDLDYTLSTLQALKRLGVTLTIDDFGTGYSGLAYLRDFPIDTVKIDMSFIKGVHQDRKNQGIVRAIIALASTMGLHTVAEGVETAEELAFLRQQACWGYQGYHFSPAREPAEIERRYLSVVRIDMEVYSRHQESRQHSASGKDQNGEGNESWLPEQDSNLRPSD